MRKRKANGRVCVCSASSVCNGSTKVNYYANANQRSTLVEKKRKKGNNDYFSRGPRYYRKNNVRAQKGMAAILENVEWFSGKSFLTNL